MTSKKITYKTIFWDELAKTDFYVARRHHKELLDKALEKSVEFLVTGMI